MKKRLGLLACSFIIATILFSQESIKQDLIKDFESVNNDSIFISKYSYAPYRLTVADLSSRPDSNFSPLYRDLLVAGAGKVLGPYESDSGTLYVKVISVDSGYKARVGNIWIDIARGRDAALALANKLLSEIKSGKGFDLYCKIYSDDKNPAGDCDLGWIPATSMVEPFAEAIIKHRKDEVYLVETSFGFHIVKSLEDPYRERTTVHYASLLLGKK